MSGAWAALANHWPEYLTEASLLAMFMVSACGFVCLIQHPASPVRKRVHSATARRVLIGLAMGLTAVTLIRSPLGQRSGAHMNPSVTITYATLGKVAPWDAVFYVLAQFLGGVAGVAVASLLLRPWVRDDSVDHAPTLPGRWGPGAAWAAEVVIAFGMMAMVLITSNSAQLAPYTPFIAGTLVALYISVEAPVSGMSLNPARSLGSWVFARQRRSLWVYFTAPPLGMLAAAGAYAQWQGLAHVYCAKLDHSGHERCIFNCHQHEMPRPAPAP